MPPREDLTPAECRVFATQARRQAALASSERDRDAWVRIAIEWDEIAAALEQLPGAPKPDAPASLH
jgi:hypothetical protein